VEYVKKTSIAFAVLICLVALSFISSIATIAVCHADNGGPYKKSKPIVEPQDNGGPYKKSKPIVEPQDNGGPYKK